MSDTDATRTRGETLRIIADWLAEHPELDGHVDYVSLGSLLTEVEAYGINSPADLAKLTAAVGGMWAKGAAGTDEQLFTLSQKIAPRITLRLIANREKVCERVKTGETVIHEPDPDAVAALPTVERVVETFEWRCEPLLASKAAA